MCTHHNSLSASSQFWLSPWESSSIPTASAIHTPILPKVVSPAWSSLLSTRCHHLVCLRDISYSDQSNDLILKSCLHVVPSTYLAVNIYITFIEVLKSETLDHLFPFPSPFKFFSEMYCLIHYWVSLGFCVWKCTILKIRYVILITWWSLTAEFCIRVRDPEWHHETESGPIEEKPQDFF